MSRSKPSPEHHNNPDPTAPGGDDAQFPVVGIGASAGGLDALTTLFKQLPPDTGMAFVVVQHLAPDQESHLPELIARPARIPVSLVTEGVVVERNHVYVIPPNKTVLIREGKLHLSPRDKHEMIPQPLNLFFNSLAAERRHLAIGVVLSGTGTDGTRGLGEIKAAGGITFAQDQESAQHTGMPLSAVQSGHVDHVLTPGQIALELGHISRHPWLSLDVPPSEEVSTPLYPEGNGDYLKIIGLMKTRTNIDFGHYRSTTLHRRIARRMLIRKIESLKDYCRLVSEDLVESDALFHDLLINVTSFFRDPEMFETLKQKVFPDIVASKKSGDTIRIWVVGCSTGQETYSLAMALIEYLDRYPVKPAVQIFASDISDPFSLRIARAGIYPESIKAEVSPDRLQRFFTHDDGGYRIIKSIREMCVFARQNLIADPPFSRMDLVSCRNVLIYLTPATQKKIIPIFHYSLNLPGFLVLGPSESVGGFAELFCPVDKKHRVYARTAVPAQSLGRFHTTAASPARETEPLRTEPATVSKVDLKAEADRILLQRFSPGGVLINQNLEILQFRGRTSPWLEPRQGEARMNIKNMARPTLANEIQKAVREVSRTGQPLLKADVRAGEKAADRVNLEIIPIRPRHGAIESFLVLFRPSDGSPDVPPAPASTPTAGTVDEEIEQLKNELATAHDYVQSIVEREETASEELRSANEEVMSANEELQSTNEELETAKEELQSTNEELQTLNQELQTRNLELSHLTDDLLNLISSLRTPIVMLTADLRMRRFTPSAEKYFNLLPNDLGRSFTDIRTGFGMPDLEKHIRRVIADAIPFEVEVLDRSGRWHLLRINPYRTSDNKLDGAVILLQDIDAAKKAGQKSRDANNLVHEVVDTLLDPLVMLDSKFNISSCNQAYCKLFGVDCDAIHGKPFFELHGAVWDTPQLRDAIYRIADKGVNVDQMPVQLVRDGTEKHYFLRGRQLARTECDPCILLALQDVTVLHAASRREKTLADAERTARMEAEQANRTKDQFLAMLSHELRNPLNAVLGWTKVLKSSKKADPEALKEGLDRIESAARMQVRMISDLLDISRIAAGKVELDLKTVDLTAVVDAAVEMFVPAAEANHVQLVRNYQDVASTILVDPQRMQQVVSNLLSNAIKFTPPGGKVEVGLNDVDHSVQIAVRDTGPGIDPEFQKHLFERFRQAEMPGTTKFAGGLGLGLAIVKHLVTLHGGTVEAHSDGKDKGAEFTVTIPYSDIAFEDAPKQPKPRTMTHHAEPRDLAGLRVLLVDDDPDACAIARRIFEEHKIKVFIALSARDGLEILKYEHPDIIVSDIGMPDQDGYELMRQIRSLPAKKGGNTPAIALTAFARPEDRKQALAVGYQKHLAKPVDPLELLTVIATLTSDKRQSNS